MKDAEFIVDGTLTEEYLIGIIKELKWNFATKEESDGKNINVLDHNGNFLGTIYLTRIKQNGEVSYGEDSLQIEKYFEDCQFKMAQPIIYFIDFTSETRHFPKNLIKRMAKDHHEIWFWIEGSDYLRPYCGFARLFKKKLPI